MNSRNRLDGIKYDPEQAELIRLGIEQCEARLKDLTERTCVDAWIRGDEAVIGAVVQYLRNKGIAAEYQYDVTSELKSIVISW